MDAPRTRHGLPRWALGCLIALGLFVVLLIIGGITFPLFRTAREKALTATGGSSLSAVPPSAARDETAMEEAEYEADAAPAESAGGGATSFLMSAAQAATLNRKIIYNADFTVEADSVDAAASSIEQAVKDAGGWISAKTIQEPSPGERSCDITARVPADKFAEVCEAFRKTGKVLSEGVTTQDVTEEFVDLEARLHNLEREEQVVAALFDREGKIADILQVERELARVRGEIEQIQGRLRYLKDQVGYSTITGRLLTKHSEAVKEMDEWDLGYHLVRAWRALVSVARALTYAVIYTVIVLGPFVVLALVLWRIARAARRRRSGPPLPPATPEA